MMVSTSAFPVSSDTIPLAGLPDVIAQIAAGYPVLVLDDAQRENEADLVCAAERISPAVMAMMIREGSGIVCLCIEPGKVSQLGSHVGVTREHAAVAEGRRKEGKPDDRTAKGAELRADR